MVNYCFLSLYFLFILFQSQNGKSTQVKYSGSMNHAKKLFAINKDTFYEDIWNLNI